MLPLAQTWAQEKLVPQRSSSIYAVTDEAAESDQVGFDLFQRDDDGSSQFVMEQRIVRGGVEPCLSCQTKKNGVVSFCKLWNR